MQQCPHIREGVEKRTVHLGNRVYVLCPDCYRRYWADTVERMQADESDEEGTILE